MGVKGDGGYASGVGFVGLLDWREGPEVDCRMIVELTLCFWMAREESEEWTMLDEMI